MRGLLLLQARVLAECAGNRGLCPSLDASDLIAVENPNCPSEKHHHYVPNNISSVRNIWIITVWTLLLAAHGA
jgi:hypothetical protein